MSMIQGFSAGWIPYDREKAVLYANTWALGRNPQYYDYSHLGGDCTNFISQCIHAGGGVMNYTPNTGWYYRNANDKAPAWTGVPYLADFLLRKSGGPGPAGRIDDIGELEPGDIIQLAFYENRRFSHSLIIVECGNPPLVEKIYINTHSYDRKRYPLTNYFWSRIQFIKILGSYGV